MAGKASSVQHGSPVSLRELFRRARLNDEEFTLLEESLRRSDELVKLEKRAFAAFEGLYDDGAGNFTVSGKPDRELAIELLFGTQYLVEKADVIAPVQRFIDLFSERMRAQAEAGLARLEQQMMTEMILIFIALLATMGIIFYTRLGILNLWLNSAAKSPALPRGFSRAVTAKQQVMK